jgi:hypothetical protein
VRNAIIFTRHHLSYDDKVKQDEICGAYSKLERDEKCIKF